MSVTKKLNIGIFACGFMGRAHSNAFLTIAMKTGCAAGVLCMSPTAAIPI